MPARKSQHIDATDADKQKQKDADVKLRMECSRVVVQLQTTTTSAAGLTRSTDMLFQYIKSGKPAER